MMINFSRNRKNKGIGLLELMLSLAIIAILLIMATRYYLVTSRSQKTDEAVSLVNALVAGAESYRGDRPTFAGLTDIKILVNQGSIAASYVSTTASTGVTTPWGLKSTANVAVTPSNDSQVTITLDQIPGTACANLVNKFKTDTTTGTDPATKGSSCTSADASRFVYYYPVEQTKSQ